MLKKQKMNPNRVPSKLRARVPVLFTVLFNYTKIYIDFAEISTITIVYENINI